MKSSIPLHRQRSVAFFLFIIFLSVGCWLALQKSLWNDEIYTQIQLRGDSVYSTAIQGKIGEGSNAPLFYVIQKFICDVTRYSFPIADTSLWYVAEPKSQIILRLQPILFMSLLLALLYYHFSVNYSVLAGVYSLGIALSSSMVWAYWAEGRPYTLWMFLSTCQILLFLSLLNNAACRRVWIMWAAVNWLLALTVIVSLPQIVICSALIWFFVDQKKNWTRYIAAAFIPAMICLYYYFNAPIYWYKLIDPMKLFLENIAVERFFFIFLWAVLFIAVGNNKEKKFFLAGRAFIIFLLLILLSSAVMLAVIAVKSRPDAGETSSRMLIHLTPLGIVGTVLASIYFWRFTAANSWPRICLALILTGGFIILGSLKTFQFISSSVIY
jgi:hypothetical protein